MDLYVLLGGPVKSESIEDFYVKYDDQYSLFVSGHLTVNTQRYYSGYNGNIMCSGYEDEIVGVSFEVTNLVIWNEILEEEIESEELRQQIIKEIEEDTVI